jgi:NAD-dependent deacetylase
MDDRLPTLVVISGAGLSAPSGVATFRDQNGLWNGYDVDVVCNALTWRDYREVVHGFYNTLRSSLASVVPTIGHRLLSNWKKDFTDRSIMLTQNVDDLLERAGCDDIIHLHGYLQDMKCIACGHVWDVGYEPWSVDNDRCPKCNSSKGVKPGVVFFNDSAPRYADLYRAFKRLSSRDVVVMIGTSGQVININALMTNCPAFKILNNLEPCNSIDGDLFHEVFYDSIETAAPALDDLVRSKMV